MPLIDLLFVEILVEQLSINLIILFEVAGDVLFNESVDVHVRTLEIMNIVPGPVIGDFGPVFVTNLHLGRGKVTTVLLGIVNILYEQAQVKLLHFEPQGQKLIVDLINERSQGWDLESA